ARLGAGGAGAENRGARASWLAALSAEARSETAGLPTVARSAKAGDLTCHSRRDNENEGHRGKTVREGSVIGRQQRMEIGHGAEQRAGRDKTDRRAPPVDCVAGVD